MRKFTKTGESRKAFFGSVRKKLTRSVEFLLAAAMLVSVTTGALKVSATDGIEVVDKTFASNNFKEGSYSWYVNQHADKAQYEGETIVIPAADYVDTNMNLKLFDSFEGEQNVLLIPEMSVEQENDTANNTGNESDLELVAYDPAYVTYKVTVPVSGMYEIYFKYYAVTGKGADIEREIHIDGEAPFIEATYLAFSRIWKDVEKVGTVFDTAGNEIRPSTVEAPEWTTKYLNDDHGYYFDAFSFYLEAGEHEIKIVSVKEPMMLAEIGIGNEATPKSYAEVKAEYAANGYAAAGAQTVKIEAEDTYLKSSSSLYPYHSRSSVSTTGVNGSFTYDHTQVNVIGGERWEQAGQWISWELTVPESGLYTISLRGRQNVNKGMSSGRCLMINGEIPFAEAENCEFFYDADYRFYTLGEAEVGEAFQFYFEAGKTYTIKLQANLGIIE
ncbi:MAG: hypothetical protein IKU55_04815, partial [Clostridia bacterium]|nr:hypothetical protein [Clostridia bacterium]